MPEEKRGHGLLLDMTVEALGSPGLVVDSDIAARTGCRCYIVDSTEMCFSRGIIGTLSRPQVEAYCPTKEILTQGITKRVKLFKEATQTCKKEIAHLVKGEKLEPYLVCMGRETRKRGIEL